MSTVEIPLTRGYVALVDAADVGLVSSNKWYALTVRNNTYAVRNLRRPDGTSTTELMHQRLTGYALTDHINGDGLDNRRSNLREATVGENCRNMRRPKNNTSGFKGVSFHKLRGRWTARICAAGKHYYLGLFDTAEQAARAYDDAARELHGEFAALNFPEHGERAA